MLWSDLARAAAIAIIPVVALAGDLRIGIIYAVAFVQSTLGIVFTCGEFAAIPSLVKGDDLIAANGRIMATNSAGSVVGPILAGILVAFVSLANLLFFDAASFLVSALALAMIRKNFDAESRLGIEPKHKSRILDDIKEGLHFVWSHPVLRAI
jgi:hypothetical protein